MPGLSGAKVQQSAGLGWLKSTTGSSHERPHAEDRSGAQHHGHGDQLDVSDSAFSGGTQWDRHLQRGELREDCQCAYGIFSFSPYFVHAVSLHMQRVLEQRSLCASVTTDLGLNKGVGVRRDFYWEQCFLTVNEWRWETGDADLWAKSVFPPG